MTITDLLSGQRAVLDPSPVSAPSPRPSRPVDRPRSPSLVVAFAVNVCIVVGFWIEHGGVNEITGGRSGFLVGSAQLSGLAAALLALAGITIAARPRALERRVGLDRAMAWHRRLGGTFATIAVAHALVSIVAYADVDQISIIHEFGELMTHYRFMVPAAIGTGMLVVIGVTSVRAIRRRLSYETWYFVHLNAYFAVALAFGHQLTAGSDLVDDRLARWYWISLHVAVLAIVVWSRIGGLLLSLTRQRLRVAEVVDEGPGVVSIRLVGPWLARLRAEAGQFFLLRVLQPGLWWQAHPFSLSAAPNDHSLRFTIKNLGDATTAMSDLRVGAPIALEGPYGCFTASACEPHRKVVLIGAGIGIAPLRALLETFDAVAAPVVLYRVRGHEDLVHLEELRSLASLRGGAVYTLIGSRRHLAVNDPFDAEELRRAVPDIADREAFVCGPESFLHAATKGLTAAGVARTRVHCERFWY